MGFNLVFKVLKHVQHNLPCSYNGVGSFYKTFIFVRTKLIEPTVYLNQCLFAYRIVRSGFQECMKIYSRLPLHITAGCHYTLQQVAITHYSRLPLHITAGCRYTLQQVAVKHYSRLPLHITAGCRYTLQQVAVTHYSRLPLNITAGCR